VPGELALYRRDRAHVEARIRGTVRRADLAQHAKQNAQCPAMAMALGRLAAPSMVRKKLGRTSLVDLRDNDTLALQPPSELGRRSNVLLRGGRRVASIHENGPEPCQMLPQRSGARAMRCQKLQQPFGHDVSSFPGSAAGGRRRRPDYAEPATPRPQDLSQIARAAENHST